MFLSATACSTSRMPASKLNCERLHTDSVVKLAELQKVFVAYQEVNVDLVNKLAPPFKSEVADMDMRVRKQKQKCWPQEKRQIDTDMAIMRDDVLKIYGEFEPKKVRVPAQQPQPQQSYYQPVPPPAAPAPAAFQAPAPAPLELEEDVE